MNKKKKKKKKKQRSWLEFRRSKAKASEEKVESTKANPERKTRRRRSRKSRSGDHSSQSSDTTKRAHRSNRKKHKSRSGKSNEKRKAHHASRKHRPETASSVVKQELSDEPSTCQEPDEVYEDSSDLTDTEFGFPSDDDGFMFSPDAEPESSISDFQCLTQEGLLEQQARAIEDIAEVLSMTPSASASLLRYFRWNRDRLFAKYLEDPAGVLKEAGVALSETYIHVEDNDTGEPRPFPYSSLANSGDSSSARHSDIIECSICGEDTNKCFALSCSHLFCKDCWEQYLTMKIKEGQAVSLQCPQYKCQMIVDDRAVKELVSEETYARYVRFLLQSFVDDNDRAKWCPGRGCTNAVTADMIQRGQTVVCTCGTRFCFRCHEDAHLPATCEQIKTWKIKCQDESETLHWISANTNTCPKCNTSIEKNGGCNHMICRQCTYEFCWVCLREWKGHSDYYSCSKIKKEERKVKKKKKKKKKSSKQKAADERIANRKALERYLYYYTKYAEHDKSRVEASIREDAKFKMERMQELYSTPAELQFFSDAVEQLLQCHSAIKNSYIIGYYLRDNTPAKDLFLILQQDLEKTTEQLEQAIDSSTSKIEVVNLTKLAQTRLNNLLDAVESQYFD